MRILFVEQNEDGTVGGSHQVLYDMVRSLDQDRYDPVVLFYEDNIYAQRFRDAGVRVLLWDEVRRNERGVHESGTKWEKLREIGRAIGRRRVFLQEQSIDVVHLNNSPHVGLDDWLPAARLARVPIVTSARGDADPIPGAGFSSRVHRWLARRFDRVLAVSEYIATAFRAQGVPADRVQVVHDGVDRSKLNRVVERTATDMRREFGVADDQAFVAMVGNVRSWKGQHVVLRALASMAPEDRNRFSVVFVGKCRSEDQDYLDSLQEFARDEDLTDIVQFAGFRTDVPDILTLADIMIHASIIPEPFGMVVIESMTFGTPVIVADKGGPLDYLQPGVGLVYDVEDPPQLAKHLLYLAKNPEVRNEMAARAQKRAAEFSIEATARKMERVYDQVGRRGG